jgi:hypothetical protein
MSIELERVVQVGLDLLTKGNVEINPETMALVKDAAAKFVDLIDGHAKQKAEAAGDAAAAGLTTEDEAEAAQRKP